MGSSLIETFALAGAPVFILSREARRLRGMNPADDGNLACQIIAI
jgi:hypothetical protein